MIRTGCARGLITWAVCVVGMEQCPEGVACHSGMCLFGGEVWELLSFLIDESAKSNSSVRFSTFGGREAIQITLCEVPVIKMFLQWGGKLLVLSSQPNLPKRTYGLISRSTGIGIGFVGMNPQFWVAKKENVQQKNCREAKTSACLHIVLLSVSPFPLPTAVLSRLAPLVKSHRTDDDSLKLPPWSLLSTIVPIPTKPGK